MEKLARDTDPKDLDLPIYLFLLEAGNRQEKSCFLKEASPGLRGGRSFLEEPSLQETVPRFNRTFSFSDNKNSWILQYSEPLRNVHLVPLSACTHCQEALPRRLPGCPDRGGSRTSPSPSRSVNRSPDKAVLAWVGMIEHFLRCTFFQIPLCL